MLVTRRDGRLRLITQPDHAALAGWFVQHWGNDRFSVPAPRDALLCAASHHDDGWLELDPRPVYNPDARRPAHFAELPLNESVGPYGRGVESVYERDLHAGVLVSMHFSGFYTSRWGVGGGPPADHPIAREVVAAQEARWMPALREAWGYRGRRSDFDVATWHAYEVLQAVDLLSLAHGLIDLEQPSGDSEPLDMSSSLATIDQAVAPRVIDGVPMTAGGPHAAIKIVVTEPRRVRLEPSPLAEPELEVAIPYRELDDRPYETADDATHAFHAAELRRLRFTITGAA